MTNSTRFSVFPLKTRPGVTVVIAMFMVLIFMIQMSSIMEMTTNSVELHKGYLTTRQAYYNARSGLELALLSQSDPDAFDEVFKGQKIKLTSDGKKYHLVFSDGSGISTGTAVATDSPVPSGVIWEIQNQAVDIPAKYTGSGAVPAGTNNNDAWQIFPFPGTGDLGAGDCDNDDPDLLEQITPFMGTQTKEEIINNLNQADFKFLDHPCFWNTLEQDQAAVIPLYTNGKDCPIDFQNEKICNPKDYLPVTPENPKDDPGQIIVKIRTPCKDGKKICAPADRYKLNDYSLTSLDTQKVVLWGISATCQIAGPESKLQSSTCYFTGAGPVDKENLKDLKDFPEKALPKKVEEDSGLNSKLKSDPLISWITGYVLNESKSYKVYNHKYYALDFSDKYADDLKNLNVDIKDPNYNNWKTNFLDKSPTILSAIKGEPPWTTYPANPDSTNPVFTKITKPKLILEIATILKDDSIPSKEIPNLEYQILYKTGAQSVVTSPISDPVIVADGYHGNFHSKLQVKMSTLGAGFSYVAIPTD